MPTAKAQPKPLEHLITRLSDALGEATINLKAETVDVDVWRDEMEKQLVKFHTAAYIAGAGRQMTLDEAARRRISGDVRVQLQYLDRFAVEIQGSSDFEQGWQARAESYADAIQIPYWAGRTKMLPLPALPGEGSQCMTHCKCLWSIDTISEDDNSYDCYWIRSAAESCQTCIERASQWNPLQIRNGVLQ